MNGAHIAEAVTAIRSRTSFEPRTGAILGSGLGSVVDADSERIEIPYAAIPHWPRSGVEGHAGVLTLGRIAGHPVALMKGRAHYYEGWSFAEVGFPVRVLAGLGVGTLVITAAAGSADPKLRPGDVVAIRDHLNFMGGNPLRGPHDPSVGPRFIELTTAYDAKLRSIALRAAKRAGIRMREGVYAAMPGPSYETPAEVRMVRRLGGHVVGMSTVPEVITARHAGLRVLALSLVTNLGAGLGKRPLSHDEVIETAGKTQRRLGALLRDLLIEIGGEGMSDHAKLIRAALGAMARAYAPYSKFAVGAALEGASGSVYPGCNVENASFGLAICAERSAACAAVTAGERAFRRVVIVTSSGRPTPPCGACRQFLKEFSPELEIIMVGESGIRSSDLGVLLPSPFDKAELATRRRKR